MRWSWSCKLDVWNRSTAELTNGQTQAAILHANTHGRYSYLNIQPETPSQNMPSGSHYQSILVSSQSISVVTRNICELPRKSELLWLFGAERAPRKAGGVWGEWGSQKEKRFFKKITFVRWLRWGLENKKRSEVGGQWWPYGEWLH